MDNINSICDSNFTIRFAQRGDEAVILGFIRELATYEHMEDQMVATERLITESIFERGRAEVLIACCGGKPIGYALFFHSYSTFLGHEGIYLEDLYVTPSHRGHGYGKKLLARLASIACERGCGRLEWACLDWNKPSIDFYLSLGARPQSEWTTYRVAGDTLRELAGKA